MFHLAAYEPGNLSQETYFDTARYYIIAVYLSTDTNVLMGVM